MVDSLRGVMYPARLPQFHRLTPAPEAEELVQWFWIPEWDIEPGRSSRQHVVAYPALNLVAGAEGVELVGASTRAGYRDLSGRGWAVGALLHPASVAALTDAPAALLDRSESFVAPELRDDIARIMGAGGELRREQAAKVFSDWLIRRVGIVGAAAREANRMATMLMSDETITRPENAAVRLSISVRTLQRLAHRYVGLTPGAMIRRRRLQEAAQRIREHPGADLAALATELGYVDHAHLTNDFRAVLGVTPREYRFESDRAAGW